ncbi:phosphoenolpyruvate carboxylase [Wenyingzhuangia fucanilytica]|uniref:Phosphoenolpyruvate carboxylase n=1 Tax=Wenyingzhuangia fucanilytica TaxID=1790137 RepID=A0A1B1Y8B8_9FLAO|nr:phosphoenolpyruvate carboxylase [Wenyingzhuangia fucanilytica]ANW96968.1 phosphoenolpyruvate carboxylase [Wenyingzhuangia fucanilytica]
MSKQTKLSRFNDSVLAKYQVYNSVFATLPFDSVEKTGTLLPLFNESCIEGFKNGKTPTEIVDEFFTKYKSDSTEEDKISFLFKFIQYIERQVVLFDAIEDAAFPIVNNMAGVGTLRNIKEEASSKRVRNELKHYLEEFKTRLVLTAHPTQFYPGTVLTILTDLQEAIKNDDLSLIKKLLAQLGRTTFFAEKKPTPYDEAISLIWYLENVFYHSISKIYDYIHYHLFDGEDIKNEIITLGFWPCGDRDGNPFVTTETTLRVARKLRQTILKNYFRDVRQLKRRLTFPGVYEIMNEIESALYDSCITENSPVRISVKSLLSKMNAIKKTLKEEHSNLFVEEVDSFINKVKIFGFHFATMDIRQDSRVHHDVFTGIVKELQEKGDNTFPKNYLELSPDEQIQVLAKVKGDIDPEQFSEEMVVRTLGSMRAISTIQEDNGERGANRYIISNNQTALNVMETFAMLNLSGFEEGLKVDVAPLFETVDDLEIAPQVMRQLYSIPEYREHVAARGNKQNIMLGFSDGTKDGGYLMANWGIYKAKEELSKVSREFGIKVIFFDGRGGPPARGGGKTSKFYASLGENIENKEIQLTIQGQTISSNFGNLDSSQYNIEQLLGAGITNKIFNDPMNASLSDEQKGLMEDLAELSFKAYSDFKNHEMFIPYLERMSTLKYYGKANIGSRPSKRAKSDSLNFGDLRAIPFVGSWSQLKQNVPGFFGVGTAFKKYKDAGEFDKVQDLYNNSNFFKTLLENSVMSMEKSNFALTNYMAKDEEFGAFWNIIHDEYLLTKELLLELAGHKELMQNFPDGKASIAVRDSIVLPLLTIQQYALREVQLMNKPGATPDQKRLETFEKIVTRSLFGNTNASRNSA